MKRLLIAAISMLAAALVTAGFVSGFRPAVAQGLRPLVEILATVSCTSTNPCQIFSNSSSGAGVQGVSSAGSGTVGQTKFNSTSSSNGRSGILGNDLSTSGTFNSGVHGVSSRGSGVSGTSTSGSGLTGVSSSGVGVRGSSSSGSGVQAISNTGVGVTAVSSGGPGLKSTSTNAQGAFVRSTNHDGIDTATTHNSTATGLGRSGIFAHDDSTDGGHLNLGVAGFSTNGIGVEGVSTNFAGVNAVGGSVLSLQESLPALSVVGNTSADGQTPYLILACAAVSGANPCLAGSSVFAVDQLGNTFIHGHLFTSGSCNSGCFPTPFSEKRVRFYTPRESLPTVEDFGGAQLVNGQSYVRIDPAFANTIDPRANYLVFITPEGDSRGLYVTSKSRSGFAVHENQGGRSTLPFSYRIVAKPFGEHPVRLQMFTVARLYAHRLIRPTYRR